MRTRQDTLRVHWPYRAEIYTHITEHLHATDLGSVSVCVGGGDREDVALSYVYANSGCVADSWLCVL